MCQNICKKYNYIYRAKCISTLISEKENFPTVKVAHG